MKRKLTILGITCCILLIWISYIGGGRLPIRIYIIASYSTTNICSRPQIEGFLNKLGKYEKMTDIHYIIRINYLNCRKISVEELNIKIKLLQINISKFHPDYIVCFDDVAFESVGLRLANTYPVLASGINMPLNEYKKKYPNANYDNIYVVEEHIELNKLFKMLHESLYPDLLYKVYVAKSAARIRNKTESIVLTQLIEELNKEKIQYQIVTVSNTRQLKDINKQIPKGTLVLIAILQFPGMSAEETIKQISSNLRKQILVGFNPYFCKIGFSICTSVSFYEMGELLADFLIKLSKNEVSKHNVRGPVYIVINVQQLNRLGLTQLLHKNKYINGISPNTEQNTFLHE